ncbi:MAG TPA: undecaprenyl-diphosphate phosphatase [Pirellulaceae bacterium]|nr:undecaprenyl-diphosphate phosphatase [Pirellulaceae bacterium]
MPPYEVPDWLRVVILAVVQGIGEFLPISSSGHVVVGDALLGGAKESTRLNIVLHLGTLLSILVFYWQRIWQLLGSDRRVIGLLIVGTIPAAVVGLTVRYQFPQLLESPLLAGFMFSITAFLLMLLLRTKEGEGDYRSMSYRLAILIGLAQALAILPGISRSGATIVAAVLLGLRRDSAATYSFLLAIPAIGGAGVLELKDLMDPTEEMEISLGLLLGGAFIAFVVGLVSLKLLVRLLDRGRLHLFAYWLIPFGMLVIVWQLHLMVQNSLGN